MRFLLDQNANTGSLPSLRTFFADHHVAHASERGWGALEDVDLFEAMAEDGFTHLITRDRNQLRDPDERAALRAHDLTWVGVRDTRAGGLLGLSIETATLLTGLPHVLARSAERGLAFALRTIPAEPAQRVKVIAL
ncbi:hypothetical protein [Cellulomonas triticagri]|uniref:VapC45 PIN like domain-containing protein n=1 Tax=Cellulomonas triticagri TaxID=2483352 RepID=A0A3M2JPH5_9CELL|nr:hypothetical protein [Cellulomonas triticagri]RMI14241.1 hypothetical protein EBM89_01190 [Cellulomonas triticagri]